MPRVDGTRPTWWTDRVRAIEVIIPALPIAGPTQAERVALLGATTHLWPVCNKPPRRRVVQLPVPVCKSIWDNNLHIRMKR